MRHSTFHIASVSGRVGWGGGGGTFRQPPHYCCKVFIAHVTRDGWGMLLDNDVMLTTEPRVCRYESFNSPLHPSGAGCSGQILLFIQRMAQNTQIQYVNGITFSNVQEVVTYIYHC